MNNFIEIRFFLTYKNLIYRIIFEVDKISIIRKEQEN